MGRRPKKLSAAELEKERRDLLLDQLQEKALGRLKKSSRFLERVQKLTGMRPAVTEEELEDTPDPDAQPEEEAALDPTASGWGAAARRGA